MNPPPKSKAAVVTGGGTWVGAGICMALASSGYEVLAVGRRSGKLEQTAHNIFERHGATIEILQADIRSDDDRRNTIATCIEKFGGIDILVNNAAVTHTAPILDYPQKDWLNVLDTNLMAPFYLSLLAIEDMKRRKWGRIVNIASIYGKLALNNAYYPTLPAKSKGDRGPYRETAYHASKGGLLNLTRELAVATGPWGITVNSISPGMMPPDADLNQDYDVNVFLNNTPTRSVGRPKHIGHAVCYFVSEQADFTTSAELVVDGGWSIW